jgi:hypothetical protein
VIAFDQHLTKTLNSAFVEPTNVAVEMELFAERKDQFAQRTNESEQNFYDVSQHLSKAKAKANAASSHPQIKE